ncbi:MAG: DUF402 domain-containing protein [Pyrinomonadaceae bacterium]
MINQNKLITINSRKFDGKIHRSWKAELIKQENFLLTFVGEFDKEIEHPHLGVIRRGTISYEFYWLDRWYNVFRFHEPDGDLRNFYCNINMPPAFEKRILDYVDLDIDVLVWKDFSFEVLDLDEFEENAVKYKYSPAIYDKANESLAELTVMIKKKSFPFSMF